MSSEFAQHRNTIANALEPLLTEIQAQLSDAEQADVDAYDVLLETTVKLVLREHGRGTLVHALDHYRDQVAGDLLTVTMAIDELPSSE